MSGDITFPTTFEELITNENDNGFLLSDPNVAAEMQNDEINDQIEDLINAGIEINSENRADTTINFIFSAIHHFNNLSVENQCMFVEYMIDISKQMIEVLPTVTSTVIKNNYKKILYLFQYLCVKLEQNFKSTSNTTTTASTTTASKSKKKNASKDTFNWFEWRSLVLEVLDLLVSPQLTSSWSMGIISENFLSHIWNYVLKLLIERPIGISGTSNKEIQNRNLCIQIITRSIHHFGNPQSSSSYETFSTALLESIIQIEHMSTTIAPEICFQARNNYSNSSTNINNKISNTCSNMNANHNGNVIISEIMTVISRMNISTSMPANSIRNISTFIESFAKIAPSFISEHFPTLLKQVDSPAHQMRSAILSACGSIVIDIHETIIAQTTVPPSVEEITASSNVTEEPKLLPNVDTTEIETNAKNIQSLMRFRDSLLDILIERTHDVNPYTRTTVLKVWSRLFESHAIPIKHAGTTASIALDRLFDKNSLARRNAIALMTACIENNPFSGTLDTTLFQLQKVEIEKIYQKRINELKAIHTTSTESSTNLLSNPGKKKKNGLQDNILEQLVEVDEENDEDDDVEDVSDEVEEGINDNAAFEESIEVQEDEMIIEVKNKLAYINSVLSFVTSIENALSKIGSMLQSKTIGDVVESLRFFTRAINFKVNGSLNYFKKGFSLVWHQDVAIKNELIAAFHNVYLTDGAATEQSSFLSSTEIVSNLINLVQHCDQAELASMEKIIGEMFSAGQVEDTVIEVLWEKLETMSQHISSSSAPGVSSKIVNNMSEQCACLSIISMIAKSIPQIMNESHMKLVIHVSLNEKNLHLHDFNAMKAAIQCIQTSPSLLKQCVTASERDVYLSSSMHNILLDASPMFATIILGHVCAENETLTRAWFGLCEEAIHGLFHFHPSPDKVMSIIIQNMYAQLQSNTTNASSSTSNNSNNVCRIARLLFVLGQTALTSLVYTEAIAAIAKKYPTKEQLQANAYNNASKNNALANSKEVEVGKNTKKGTAGGAAAASGTKFVENEGAVDAMEEEMGAAAAADADHERLLNHIIEQELVIKNLLGKFLPLLSYLVANEQNKYTHQLLRETSILAMCRYMSTSSSVCESLLPLLFTIVERETSVVVRTTVVIALGDLAFRFPNSIEPWTNRLYSRLSDANVIVRYNTLMVITHLVLNDMIKVKGQVSHVANSLNDENESIRELAKLFFIKLSERSNNPVYNLLGDIISIFSNDSTEQSTVPLTEGTHSNINTSIVMEENKLKLSKEQFQSTMHFLLSFVQKDKQADALLERLLARMSMSTSVSQRRNLAFCISELTVTEKGIKKMIELIKNIKDSLYDNEVYEYFKITLSHCKKSSRSTPNSTAVNAETKSAIEEFETLMTHIHAQANGLESTSSNLDSQIEKETINENENMLDDEEQNVIQTAIVAQPLPSKKSSKSNINHKNKKTIAISKKNKSKKQKEYDSEEEDEEDSIGSNSSNEIEDQHNNSDHENNKNKSNVKNNKNQKLTNAMKKNVIAITNSKVTSSNSRRKIQINDDEDEFI